MLLFRSQIRVHSPRQSSKSKPHFDEWRECKQSKRDIALAREWQPNTAARSRQLTHLTKCKDAGSCHRCEEHKNSAFETEGKRHIGAVADVKADLLGTQHFERRSSLPLRFSKTECADRKDRTSVTPCGGAATYWQHTEEATGEAADPESLHGQQNQLELK